MPVIRHSVIAEHLHAARSLDSRWSSIPKHEEHRWDLSISDIACGAEAVFWLEVQGNNKCN